MWKTDLEKELRVLTMFCNPEEGCTDFAVFAESGHMAKELSSKMQVLLLLVAQISHGRI